MKKFFSLVLALVMALSLTTVAWGAEVTAGNATELASAITNASAGDTIKLTADISASDIITIDKAVTLDGAKGDGTNYTLTSTAGRAINVACAGEVTIKNLTVVASGERAINVITQPATLTIENVTATAGNYALNVATSAGATNITVKDSSFSAPSNTVQVAAPGAIVTLENCTIASTGSSANEVYGALTLGKEAPGAHIIATGCTITVADSDSYEGKIVADGGEIYIDDPNAIVVKHVAYIPYGSNYKSYATIQEAIDYAEADSAPEVILMEAAVNSGESFTITEGSGVTVTPPAGADLVDDGTGSLIVAPAGTTGAGVAAKLYVADGAAANGWRLLASFPGVELDDLKADDENFLPCYDIPGCGYFTETTAAAGAYKLTYGAKTVYLKNVDWDTVYFDAKATVFTNVTDEDDVCGKLYVADLDDKDVFYSVYVKAEKTTYYFVADKNGPVQLLVNGKLVKADFTAVQELTPHAWNGYDVVNHAYTTVKCANCGKVAPLFANATAAGKDAFKVVVNGETLGWIAKVANDFTAAGSVGTTDKTVESAKTFDAGIAMYVGMSVMAAAGSAVVIGKKKD